MTKPFHISDETIEEARRLEEIDRQRYAAQQRQQRADVLYALATFDVEHESLGAFLRLQARARSMLAGVEGSDDGE